LGEIPKPPRMEPCKRYVVIHVVFFEIAEKGVEGLEAISLEAGEDTEGYGLVRIAVCKN